MNENDDETTHSDEATAEEQKQSAAVEMPADQVEQSREEVLLSEPADANSALRTELDAAEARAMRAYADLDNYKKRFDREIARQRDTERERFLNEVLLIADNLRRALNVKGAENSPYREGLLTVMRQIDNMLKGFGVEPIAAEQGMAMDPNIHEAITTMNVAGAPHESILELVEPGYMMGERVLRPARVVVATSADD